MPRLRTHLAAGVQLIPRGRLMNQTPVDRDAHSDSIASSLIVGRARAWKPCGLRPIPWEARGRGLRLAHRLAKADLPTAFPQDPRAHRPCGPVHRLPTPSRCAWRPPARSPHGPLPNLVSISSSRMYPPHDQEGGTLVWRPGQLFAPTYRVGLGWMPYLRGHVGPDPPARILSGAAARKCGTSYFSTGLTSSGPSPLSGRTGHSWRAPSGAGRR